MLTKAQMIAVAVNAAVKHNLPPPLVCSIVQRETTWNPFAIRYEAGFFNKYVLPAFSSNKFDVTEAKARSISWGLMQVMGQVAREFGFKSDLASLCDPEIGIEIGCQVFAHKMKDNSGDVARALLAWNGGDNPNYPEEVLAFMPQFSPPGDKGISA
jgi:soluble lytic murein transglycosylase-like protein